MSGGHPHGLYVHGSGPLYAAPASCKLAAAGGCVAAVAVTPRAALWAFAAYGVAVVGIALSSGLRPAVLGRRLVFVLPVVLFALLLPLVSPGPRVGVAGVALSREGLWDAWALVVRATLGAAAIALCVSTTEVAEVLRGLERLRVPRVFTAIAGFMVRYADVLAGEVQRMQVARLSRGYDPRWLWQARAVASTAGTLFVRSYERGERVYVAMLSRGYHGHMPDLAGGGPAGSTATPADWRVALAVPAAAAVVAAASWTVGR